MSAQLEFVITAPARATNVPTTVSRRTHIILPSHFHISTLLTPMFRLETCTNGFRTCGNGASNCFCFSDYLGAGFCGQNIICSAATACKDNTDCNGGSICATNTCCPAPSQAKPGICLAGQCANPANKLRRMAAMRRNYVGGDTAAWMGFGEA